MRADSVLPRLYIAAYAPELPLYAHMQPVCPRGSAQARTPARLLAGNQAYMPLSPLGRERLRPCTMTLADFDDIHTHGRRGPKMITSISPDDTIDTSYGEAWYSVGIHPWDTENLTPGIFDRMRRLAADPRVVAIGEAGLDAQKGAGQDIQEKIFLEQAAIAEEVAKPLIIHCVGRFGRIMELRKAFPPKQRWVIHGFRRKPELARQLVDAGFDISIGTKYNPGVPAVVPPGRLYHETDCDRP